MKYLILLIATLSIISCCKNKNNNTTNNSKPNKVSFKLNGEFVEFSEKEYFPYLPYGTQDTNKFDMFITIPYSTGLGNKEYFAINNINKNSSKQTVYALHDQLINPSTVNFICSHLSNTIIGGDSQCERFIPDTTDQVNNWIQNMSNENNYKTVDGEFNLKLIKVIDCPDRNYPDTLFITEGKYHINLKE